MTLSELIERLEVLKEFYGDVDVMVSDRGGADLEIKNVWVCRTVIDDQMAFIDLN